MTGDLFPPTITSPSQCTLLPDTSSPVIDIASRTHLSSVTLVDINEGSHDVGYKDNYGEHSSIEEVVDVFADRKLDETIIPTPSDAVRHSDDPMNNEEFVISSSLTVNDTRKKNDIPDPVPSSLYAFDTLMMFSDPFGPAIRPSSACYPTPSEVPVSPSSSSISLVFPSIPSLPQTPIRQSTSRRYSSLRTSQRKSVPENAVPATPIKKQRFFSKNYLFYCDDTRVMPPAGPSNLDLPIHRLNASGACKELHSYRTPPRSRLSPLSLSLASLPSISSLNSLQEDVFYSVKVDVQSPLGKKSAKGTDMHLKTLETPSPRSARRYSADSLVLHHTNNNVDAQALPPYSLDLPGVQLRSSSTFSLLSHKVGSESGFQDSIFGRSGDLSPQESRDLMDSGDGEALLKTDNVSPVNGAPDGKVGSAMIPVSPPQSHSDPVSLSKWRVRGLLKRVFEFRSWSQLKSSSISKSIFSPTIAPITSTSLTSESSDSGSFPAKLVCETRPTKKSGPRQSRKLPLEIHSALNKLRGAFKWNNCKEETKNLRDRSTKLKDTPGIVGISKRVKNGLREARVRRRK